MNTWPLRVARAKFGEIVDRAESDGPQTLTKRGKPLAAVLAIDDFKKLAGEAQLLALLDERPLPKTKV